MAVNLFYFHYGISDFEFLRTKMMIDTIYVTYNAEIELLYMGFIFYNYITNKNKSSLVKSFFVGVIFVFAQSLTNLFANNLIGLAFILISMIALHELKKIDLISLQ